MSLSAIFSEILDNKEEICLKVRVVPASGKSCFLGLLADGSWKIALKAQAEKGKANLELISYLSKELKLEKEQIKIISGKTARIKLLKIKVRK